MRNQVNALVKQVEALFGEDVGESVAEGLPCKNSRDGDAEDFAEKCALNGFVRHPKRFENADFGFGAVDENQHIVHYAKAGDNDQKAEDGKEHKFLELQKGEKFFVLAVPRHCW